MLLNYFNFRGETLWAIYINFAPLYVYWNSYYVYIPGNTNLQYFTTSYLGLLSECLFPLVPCGILGLELNRQFFRPGPLKYAIEWNPNPNKFSMSYMGISHVLSGVCNNTSSQKVKFLTYAQVKCSCVKKAIKQTYIYNVADLVNYSIHINIK